MPPRLTQRALIELAVYERTRAADAELTHREVLEVGAVTSLAELVGAQLVVTEDRHDLAAKVATIGERDPCC